MFIQLNPDGGPHRHVLTLTIPDEAWAYAGDEPDCTSRLVARIAINSVGFHLTAIAMNELSQLQLADNPNDEKEFSMLHDAFNADGHYDTITINGRAYAVFGDFDN